MPITFPAFTDNYADAIEFCCNVRVKPDHPFLVAREKRECRYGDGFWCRVITEPWEIPSQGTTSLHLHVNFKRSFGATKSKATHSLEDIQTALEQMRNCDGDGFASADYRIPESAIPSNGLVKAFLGIATEHGGMKLDFRGATMSIDDESFDKFSWKMEDGELSASLEAVVDYQFDDDVFVRTEQFLRGGLRSLVLESKNAATDESRGQEPIQPPRTDAG